MMEERDITNEDQEQTEEISFIKHEADKEICAVEKCLKKYRVKVQQQLDYIVKINTEIDLLTIKIQTEHVKDRQRSMVVEINDYEFEKEQIQANIAIFETNISLLKELHTILINEFHLEHYYRIVWYIPEHALPRLLIQNKNEKVAQLVIKLIKKFHRLYRKNELVKQRHKTEKESEKNSHETALSLMPRQKENDEYDKRIEEILAAAAVNPIKDALAADNSTEESSTKTSKKA